jgi:hypothetical protein
MQTELVVTIFIVSVKRFEYYLLLRNKPPKIRNGIIIGTAIPLATSEFGAMTDKKYPFEKNEIRCLQNLTRTTKLNRWTDRIRPSTA